jgi:hypothetical protein
LQHCFSFFLQNEKKSATRWNKQRSGTRDAQRAGLRNALECAHKCAGTSNAQRKTWMLKRAMHIEKMTTRRCAGNL